MAGMKDGLTVFHPKEESIFESQFCFLLAQLPNRLMVGLLPLEEGILVRIQVRQL